MSVPGCAVPLVLAPIAPTLSEVIQLAGLTSNLQLCLDVGDPASYASGQTWADRSGNAYNFYLGADGSATASDPTYAAVADRQSYFSFDGGDYFTLAQANPTWINNMHKNNAAWTWLMLYRHPASGNIRPFGTDASSSSSIGCDVAMSGNLNLEVNNGGAGAAVLDVTSDSLSNYLDRWNVVACSLNEAAGAAGSFFYHNGNYAQVGGSNTFDGTYSSPSASSATYAMNLMALGNAVNPTASDTRISCVAFWSAALSKANIDSIWTLLRTRFGI